MHCVWVYGCVPDGDIRCLAMNTSALAAACALVLSAPSMKITPLCAAGSRCARSMACQVSASKVKAGVASESLSNRYNWFRVAYAQDAWLACVSWTLTTRQGFDSPNEESSLP